METYKKPVVASKQEASIFFLFEGPRPPAPPFPFKKLFGDDDFHPENSRALTTRKEFTVK